MRIRPFVSSALCLGLIMVVGCRGDDPGGNGRDAGDADVRDSSEDLDAQNDSDSSVDSSTDTLVEPDVGESDTGEDAEVDISDLLPPSTDLDAPLLGQDDAYAVVCEELLTMAGSNLTELQGSERFDRSLDCSEVLAIEYAFFSAESIPCTFSVTSREDVEGYGTEVRTVDPSCTARAYATCIVSMNDDPCNIGLLEACQPIFEDCD